MMMVDFFGPTTLATTSTDVSAVPRLQIYQGSHDGFVPIAESRQLAACANSMLDQLVRPIGRWADL